VEGKREGSSVGKGRGVASSGGGVGGKREGSSVGKGREVASSGDCG